MHDLLPSNHQDCDFGLLWEAQKEVLELLDNAGERGVVLEDVAERYRLLGLHDPEWCEGIPLLDWLRWMHETQLISCDEGRATIAEMGRFVLCDLDRNHIFADHRCVQLPFSKTATQIRRGCALWTTCDKFIVILLT